jgi:hypothetical protein
LAESIEPATDRNQDAAAIQSGLLSAKKKVFSGLKCNKSEKKILYLRVWYHFGGERLK